jgi:ankyrin repeat protein
LHVAAETNQLEMVDLLVRHGASFDTKFGTSAHSALSWALTSESIAAAKRLVELGNEPDLFCAAGLGDLDRVKAFWRDGNLESSLSKTGSSRTTESGEPLVAPPTAVADQVSDALYMSSRLGRLEVSRWLLDHGGDPDWRGYCGATCLAWAEYSGNVELCTLLRERGASDDIIDFTYGAPPSAFGAIVLANWGFTPRLRNALSRDPWLANARARIGTPLHAAAIEGQGKSAHALIEFGADRTAKDSLGRTAADLALERGYPELATALR